MREPRGAELVLILAAFLWFVIGVAGPAFIALTGPASAWVAAAVAGAYFLGFAMPGLTGLLLYSVRTARESGAGGLLPALGWVLFVILLSGGCLRLLGR
jgi:hypothetical protein